MNQMPPPAATCSAVSASCVQSTQPRRRARSAKQRSSSVVLRRTHGRTMWWNSCTRTREGAPRLANPGVSAAAARVADWLAVTPHRGPENPCASTQVGALGLANQDVSAAAERDVTPALPFMFSNYAPPFPFVSSVPQRSPPNYVPQSSSTNFQFPFQSPGICVAPHQSNVHFNSVNSDASSFLNTRKNPVNVADSPLEGSGHNARSEQMTKSRPDAVRRPKWKAPRKPLATRAVDPKPKPASPKASSPKDEPNEQPIQEMIEDARQKLCSFRTIFNLSVDPDVFGTGVSIEVCERAVDFHNDF
jgi:hypothetical protein